MNYLYIPALSETGAELSAVPVTMGALHVYNSDSLSVVFLKMFDSTSAPTYASDSPDLVFAIPAGTSVCINMAEVHMQGCYIQASSNAGASASAPAADLMVSIVYML